MENIIICRCVFLLETVDFHCQVSLLHRHGRSFCEGSYELPDSWTKTKPSNIVHQVSWFSWHQVEKASCYYYTISIKLKYLLKNQPASLLHTPNHKKMILYTRDWVFPLIFYAKTCRIPDKPPGRVGKNQSCLDNSLSARTRGFYQVLTAVLVDKDRKTRAGSKFSLVLILEFWNLGCNLFSKVQ